MFGWYDGYGSCYVLCFFACGVVSFVTSVLLSYIGNDCAFWYV